VERDLLCRASYSSVAYRAGVFGCGCAEEGNFLFFDFAVTAILPLLISLVFLVIFFVFGSCAEEASAGILVLPAHTHTHTHT
jgi:hypothetical protein